MSISNPYETPVVATSKLKKKSDGLSPMMALKKTRPWVLFLGILGLLSSFSVFGTALFFYIGALSAGGMDALLPATIGAGGVILVGMLYFIPALILVRYGLAIGEYLATPSRETLFKALNAQMSFWRLIGIVTAIVIGLYLIIIALALSLGLLAAFTG